MSKRSRPAFRMAVDCSMAILLPPLMAYSLLGEIAHEWLGIAMSALFILHHVLNRKWYGGLCKGRYSAVRLLGTVTDLLLLASYWGLVLMSFHAGLHGGAVMAMLRKRANGKSAARTMALRAFTILLGVWGIFVFLRREIGSYLFLRNQFVFFDFNQPLLFFVADYIAVMVLFAMAGHYSAKLLKRQHS